MKNSTLNEQDRPGSNGGSEKGAIYFLMDVLDRLVEAQEADPSPSADYQAEGAPTAEPAPSTDDDGPRATLGAVMGQLDQRAYGFLLLLLALPCCLPFVYGLPQIVALPMMAIAGQMAMGRATPWLPKKLEERSFSVVSFKNVLERASKYIGWFERFAHPRLSFVTRAPGSRVLGALLLIPCASILLPLPSTNTLPGIGVTIASVGLIERDGLLTLFGLMIGLLWVALLVFLGAEAVQWIKGML